MQRLTADLPDHLERIPDEENQAVAAKGLLGAWRSRRFIVQHWRDAMGEHLSVVQLEQAWLGATQKPRPISHEELQRLRREAGFGDRWCVEVFPPDLEAEILAGAMGTRHLWIIDGPPSFWNPGPAEQESATDAV